MGRRPARERPATPRGQGPEAAGARYVMRACCARTLSVQAVARPSVADGLVWVDLDDVEDDDDDNHDEEDDEEVDDDVGKKGKKGKRRWRPTVARIRSADDAGSAGREKGRGEPWTAVRIRRRRDLDRASRMVYAARTRPEEPKQGAIVLSEWIAKCLHSPSQVEVVPEACNMSALPIASDVTIQVSKAAGDLDVRFGVVVIKGCLVCVDAFGKTAGLVTRIRARGISPDPRIARVGPRTQIMVAAGTPGHEVAAEGAGLRSASAWSDAVSEALGPHVRDAARLVTSRMSGAAQRLGDPRYEPCFGRGFLVTGPSGVGKSLFAETLARTGGADIRVLRPTDYFRTAKGEGEAALMHDISASAFGDDNTDIMAQEVGVDAKTVGSSSAYAADGRPRILVVDQIDLFDLTTDLGRILVAALDRTLAHSCVPATFIVGLTDAAARVDADLRSSRRLGTLVELRGPLGGNERTALAEKVLRKALGAEPPAALVEALSRRANGRLPAEMSAAANELALGEQASGLRSAVGEGADVESADEMVTQALVKVGAASLRDSTVLGADAAAQGMAWDAGVGGLEEAKQRLQTAVLLPLRSPEAMAALGLRRGPRGILLYGPSGNGKTLLARSLAGLLDQEGLANFVSVSCPDLVSKVVGASEAAIGALFRRAAAAAPCIVFLDQIDALAPARGNDSTSEQSMDRLLSMLLTEMDGIHAKGHAAAERPVVVLAATDRRDSLDPAILRPGRFDEHIFVGPPETAQERVDVARVALRRTPFASESARSAFIEELLQAHPGTLSAAHLSARAHAAVLEALRCDPSLACMP